MRNLKRISAFCFALLMALSVLGCDNNANDNGSAQPVHSDTVQIISPAPDQDISGQKYLVIGAGYDEVLTPMFESIQQNDICPATSMATLEYHDKTTNLQYSFQDKADKKIIYDAKLTAAHTWDDTIASDMQKEFEQTYTDMLAEYTQENLIAGSLESNIFAFHIQPELGTDMIYIVETKDGFTCELTIQDYTGSGLPAAKKRANLVLTAAGQDFRL